MKKNISCWQTKVLKGLYVIFWTVLVFFSLYYIDLNDLRKYWGATTQTQSTNEIETCYQSTELNRSLFHANFDWKNEVSLEMKQDKIYIPFFIAIIMMFVDVLYSYVVEIHGWGDKDVFGLIGGIIALFICCLLIGLTKTLGCQCLMILSMFIVLGIIKAFRTPARTCVDALPSDDWNRVEQKRNDN